ncbi:MAG: hypothetical protein U0229_22490 [Anaeromyxobacter sp.]
MRKLAVCFALALAACNGSSGSPEPTPQATLSVSPATASLETGAGSQLFTATLTGATTPIAWSLSPAGAGTLSAASGATTTYTPPATVAAQTAVTVIATSGTLTASATVTVSPPPPPSLTVSPEAATVGAGGAGVTLVASLANSTAAITWTVDPVGVGTLSTALGSTTLYTPPSNLAAPQVVSVTAAAGALSAKVTLTVNPPPSLTVSPGTAAVTAGGSAVPLSAALAWATGDIVWSLSPAVGSLSAASGASTSYLPPATIGAPVEVTVTASAAGLTAQAKLTVNPAVVPTLTLAASSGDTAVGGAPVTLTATPSGGASGTVAWSTPVTGTLAVAGNSATYTPPATLAAQQVVDFTATLAGAGLSATTTVTVHLAPTASMPASTSVSFGGAPLVLAAVVANASGPAEFALVTGSGTLSATGNTAIYTPPAECTFGPEAATVRATVPGYGGRETTAETMVTIAQAGTLAVQPAALDLVAGDPAVPLTAILEGGAVGPVRWTLSPPNAGGLSADAGSSTSFTAPAAGHATAKATPHVFATAGCLIADVPVALHPAPGAEAVEVYPPVATAVPGGKSVRFETRTSPAGLTRTFSMSPPLGILVQDGEDVVYMPPASVAATQVVTLTVQAGGATIQVPVTLAGPEGITVEVWAPHDAWSLADLRMLIEGSLQRVPASGRLTFEHVHPPYQLLVRDPGSVSLADGLTRSHLLWSWDTYRESTVNVTVTGRTPGMAARAVGGDLTSGAALPAGTSTFTLYPYWYGAASMPVNLRVLEWQADAAGLPVTYGKFGVATPTLTDGVTEAVEVALGAPAGTSTLSGTMSTPAGHTAARLAPYLRFPGVNLLLPTYTSAPATWSYAVPVVDGTTLIMNASATDAAGGTTTASQWDLAPGATGVALAPWPAPAAIEPVAAATGVGPGTRFAWSGGHGYRYALVYPKYPTTGPSFILFSSADEVTFPDLTPFGVTLPAGGTYNWRVSCYSDDRYTWDNDGLMSPYPMWATSGRHNGSTALRTFTFK